MTFKGIKIDEACLECGYLNQNATVYYKCRVPGSCPGFLSNDDQGHLIDLILKKEAGIDKCPDCGGKGHFFSDIGDRECESCNGFGVKHDKV